jgi:hypothetical protein
MRSKRFCQGKRFPVAGTIVLILSLLWLLKDMYLININIPILPMILITVALSWITTE